MSKRRMTEAELTMMQNRINEGILLAQRRLVSRGLHDNLSFIVCQGGMVCDVPANKISKF